MQNRSEATLEHGQLRLLDQAQPLDHVRVIVSMLPSLVQSRVRRQHPAPLAGKVKETRNVMSSVSAEDWGMNS
ncbi:MAG: hypothetical protein Q7T36_16915 [Fluviicoccus sp.]|uniref:hypothetical protein n=1 Tax=Fluviicoccus sp. TaxID=2003552 RepID=UPI00271A26F5|nr:hypothetical protein [Fluviicoccus sp.]MDO8332149.1 hypothetical protein [Fluviicoccus sp.]